MNSSVMPDKILPEHQFRDHLFTTRAIDTLKKMANLTEYFMLNIEGRFIDEDALTLSGDVRF